MEKNFNALESDEEQQIAAEAQEKTVCDICGEEYEQPLNAELISNDHSEEYLGCPRCLTKVEGRHKEEPETIAEDEDTEEQPELQIKQEDVERKVENPTDCPQYLGYLRKKPKNSPIPDSCFVCSKMIDCTL